MSEITPALRISRAEVLDLFVCTCVCVPGHRSAIIEEIKNGLIFRHRGVKLYERSVLITQKNFRVRI